MIYLDGPVCFVDDPDVGDGGENDERENGVVKPNNRQEAEKRSEVCLKQDRLCKVTWAVGELDLKRICNCRMSHVLTNA